MTRYSSGRALEYKVRDRLEAAGYVVVRAAGSKGVADLWAIRADTPMLFVQVKASAGPLPPRERVALIELASTVCGVPVHAFKPSRGAVTYRRLTGPGPRDHTPWPTNEERTQ